MTVSWDDDLRDRDAGTLGFTTSLGFSRKLDRIAADPRVAMAFHTRKHGRASASRYVLAQGLARVIERPSDAELPPGGRRAGLLGHSYRPQLIGLKTRQHTGWLEVDGGSARYAPHTETGYQAPANKTLLLLVNGGLAKRGVRQGARVGKALR